MVIGAPIIGGYPRPPRSGKRRISRDLLAQNATTQDTNQAERVQHIRHRNAVLHPWQRCGCCSITVAIVSGPQ